MRTMLIALCVMILAGCGGPMLFAKAGATPTDLERDGYDCEVQWDQSSQGIAFRLDPLGNLYQLTQVRDYHTACMARRGWTRTDK